VKTRRFIISTGAVLAWIVLGASGTLAQQSATPASDAVAGNATATAQTTSNPARPNGTRSDYLIGNSDVLTINVWKEPEVSRTVPVRADGRISLPLVGEIQAAGKTPAELQNDISKGLHDYISEPEVTVIVQEQKSQRFNILGQVQKPGSYLLNPPMTVLDAIAIAGGFRDFAKVKNIKVMRQQADGTQVSYAFNYKQAMNGSNPAQNIELQAHDTIYVP